MLLLVLLYKFTSPAPPPHETKGSNMKKLYFRSSVYANLLTSRQLRIIRDALKSTARCPPQVLPRVEIKMEMKSNYRFAIGFIGFVSLSSRLTNPN